MSNNRNKKITQILASESTFADEMEGELGASAREWETKYRAKSTKLDEIDRKKSSLSEDEKNAYDELMSDIQNVIWALGFERAPLKSIDTKVFLSFFSLEQQASLEPLWRKIVVADGLKTSAMHEVLKAAKLALQKFDIEKLNKVKKQYAGQYDISAQFLNQPGWHVNKILLRVNTMLEKLCEDKYAVNYSRK
jgi:hypothetical protein